MEAVTMYTRISNSGQEVEWNPENEQFAEQAMKMVPETGVPDSAELPGDAPVELEQSVGAKVNQVYFWLTYLDTNTTDDVTTFSDSDTLESRYNEVRAEEMAQ